MLKLIDLNFNNNIDIDSYLELYNKAKLEMSNPSFLGDIDKLSLQEMINNGSKIWLFTNDNNPICSMMIIPSNNKSLQKLGINKEESEVIDYGPMFVFKKYQGNNLQYQMLTYLDNYCKEIGYKYALSTIAPKNTYSINNLEKDNFIHINTKTLRRGIRNIYLKKL